MDNINSIMSNVFIISAPSGAGKTSLVKSLCHRFDFIRPSVSYTTRKIRDSELNGIDYFYVNDEEFDDKIQNNEFLEYQNVYGNMYGSTLNSVNAIRELNKDVILEIDYQGMMSVKNRLPEAISIYITPPSINDLRKRLKQRGEDLEDVIETRMSSCEKELKYADLANYVIINDDFDTALNSLSLIILLKKLPVKEIKSWMIHLQQLNNPVV